MLFFHKTRNSLTEVTLGILTNTRAPVVRKPSELFRDRSYGVDSDASRADSQLPPVVFASAEPSVNPPQPGTELFIICPKDGKPTIWTTDATRGCVGWIDGPEGLEIARFCQSNQQGLIGTIEEFGEGVNSNRLRIRIDAR